MFYADRAKTAQRSQYQIIKTIALLKVGRGRIECVNCGCNDKRIIEFNHKNGGSKKEYKALGKHFYRQIANGHRDIEDLDLRCRPCNALQYIERKYGKLPMKITWDDVNKGELPKEVYI